jgi:hypothetical protein
VKQEAEALGRTVGSADKKKLDEYLTSVREVEKRVDVMRAAKGQGRRSRQGEEPSPHSPWIGR